MKKIEKLKHLEKVRKELKSCFVGLDDIIDDLIKSISPWYITPEVINRPTVISLWGMTGTGKTSVLKKLVELLGINDKTITFDCGRESEGSSYGDSLSDKITDILGNDDESLNNNIKDAVFVFDEFQYARTIDEDGNEITKAALRPIWNIIDDGFLCIYESRYSINQFQEFLDDASSFLKEIKNKTIKLSGGKITDPEDISLVKNSTLGYFYFNIDLFGEKNGEEKPVKLGKKVDDKDDSEGIDVCCALNNYILKAVYRKLNNYRPGFGDETFIRLKNSSTFNEFLEIFLEIKGIVLAPKVLDCSKALVFIVGNLDEAFRVQSELDHDADADTFADITSKVSVTDIKNSLKLRFRAEQISRFGNNLIKYPTLRKKHFEEIIKNETARVLGEFRVTSGIDVSLDSNIYDMLYSEGVCPTQGVRPVFTTIGMLLTPILSEIIIQSEENYKTVKLIIDDNSIASKFKVPKCNIKICFIEGDKEIKTTPYTIKLQMGELREPKSRKTRYICSTHEAGHAITMAAFTGELPVKIVSVDASNGGTCYTFNKDRHSEIPSIRDFYNNIRIGLGGYLAEKVIFAESNPEQLLLGSGSDLEGVWEDIEDAVYRQGLLAPCLLSNYNVAFNSPGIPKGLSLEDTYVFMEHGTERGTNAIKKIIELAEEEVTKLLTREEELLVKVSLYLAENGSMGKDVFGEYINKYGTGHLKQDIEKSIEELSYSWYKSILEEKNKNIIE